MLLVLKQLTLFPSIAALGMLAFVLLLFLYLVYDAVERPRSSPRPSYPAVAWIFGEPLGNNSTSDSPLY